VDRREETDMSQSKKVEQSKLTQLDEAIETSVSVIKGDTTEKLQSDGRIVYTSQTGVPTKKTNVVDKMMIAFENDFSEMEDAFLRFAEEKG
tara:strand:- start:35 stop:307 length:273 start_codon:yes stop_codon:yes gene_type:complete